MEVRELLVVTKLQKWGSSLGLRLPKKLAEDLKMAAGTEVDIAVVKGKLVLTPLPRKAFSLDQLLDGVTPENRHQETDLRVKRGQESW